MCRRDTPSDDGENTPHMWEGQSADSHNDLPKLPTARAEKKGGRGSLHETVKSWVTEVDVNWWTRIALGVFVLLGPSAAALLLWRKLVERRYVTAWVKDVPDGNEEYLG